jgi:hypothetical protein
MKKAAHSSISIVITLCIMGTLFFVTALIVSRPGKNLVDTSRSNAAKPQVTTTRREVSLERAEKKLLNAIPDFPIYPGTSIEHSYVKREGDLVGYEVEWKTFDTVAVVTQWYVQALPVAGWTVTRTPDALATITPPGPLTDIEFMVTAVKNNTQVNLIIENEHGGAETEIYAEFPLRKQ